MKFGSAISRAKELDAAIGEAAADLREELGDAAADLLAVFASPHHAERADDLVSGLRTAFPEALLLGCSATSVIGGGLEAEEQPALALAGAELPGVSLDPFHLEPEALLAGAGGTEDLARRLGRSGESAEPAFLLLGDPFTSAAEPLLRELDREFPASVKVGGLASGGQAPGTSALLLGDEIHRSGWIGLALSGNVAIDTIVAQGCRPVGHPMFVTRCSDNLLYEVDGRPPGEVLSELYGEADPREQALFRSSLFLGIEMRADQHEYGQGDFLIRNLVGGDPESGTLSVAANLEETQVVQFHLRDAETASSDLEQRLTRYAAQRTRPRGALLFSCLGRGSGLYGLPNHDTTRFREHVGDVPVAGFFCNGEIGPVERRTFLHGYTSAFAIFRTRES